jgi:thioredoxin 1
MKYLLVIFVLLAASILTITIKGRSSQEAVYQPTITPTNTSTTPSSVSTRYVPYSQSEFERATDKKRVYFFHASWCPTCKVANIEFSNEAESIPEDVIVFKTDYDTQKELKKQFAITYQHTFVLVDTNGNEIKKWNGGGIEELIKETK